MEFYHNPRCQKSRQALSLLEEKDIKVEVRKYLQDPPSKVELQSVLTKLGMRPMELIRKNESLFKTEFKGKEYTDDEWIEIMVQNPKLIERPILITEDKAALGRPPENVLDIL